MQLCRAPKYPKVVLLGIKDVVCCFSDLEGVIQPGKESIRAIATKLGGKIEFGHCGILLFGPAANLCLTPYVFQRNGLIFIYKEDTELTCPDDLLDLVLPQMAEHSRLFVEPMSLIDDETIENILVDRME